MTAWPATLPKPLMAGFKETQAQNSIRSDMETGPAKVRRRTTANAGQMEFSLLLTSAQLDTLLGLFEDDLYSGSLAFTFTHPRTAESLSCRFLSPPTYVPASGSFYNASVSLEVLP